MYFFAANLIRLYSYSLFDGIGFFVDCRLEGKKEGVKKLHLLSLEAKSRVRREN